jgi:ABC-2 type transport system permease protein
MTTTAPSSPPPAPAAGPGPARTIDISQERPVPFGRLVAVETRKAFDTRSGRWLTISIIGLVLVVMVVAVLAFPEDGQDYVDLLGLAGGVLGYFLPILMILLVTSEWTQRTGLATFTLEPRRPRVIWAKIASGVCLSIAALVIGAVLAAAGTALSPVNGGTAVWNLGADQVQSFLLTGLISVFVGFALAMLLRNSAAAIVAYFVYTFILPAVTGTLSALVDGFDKVAPWIEFNTAQTPLFSGDFRPTGEEWAQIAVTGTIWLVLPFLLGLWRLNRAEVK